MLKEERKMKKYEILEIKIVSLSACDVLTESYSDADNMIDDDWE